MPVNAVGIGPVAPGILVFPFPVARAPELTPDIVGTQTVIVNGNVWNTAELGRRLRAVPFEPALFTQDDVPQRFWPRAIVELIQRVAPRIAVAVPMLFPTDLPPARQAAYRSAATEQLARPGRGYQDALFQVAAPPATSVELIKHQRVAQVTVPTITVVQQTIAIAEPAASPAGFPPALIRRRAAPLRASVTEQPERRIVLPITGISVPVVPVVPPPICITPTFSFETAEVIVTTGEFAQPVIFTGEDASRAVLTDVCGDVVGPAFYDGVYVHDGSITYGELPANGECVTPNFSGEAPMAVSFTDACDDLLGSYVYNGELLHDGEAVYS